MYACHLEAQRSLAVRYISFLAARSHSQPPQKIPSKWLQVATREYSKRVGAFYEGQLEEQEGAMWRMKVGSARALVTAAKLRAPTVGQKLWVRILAADLKPPRLAFARVLNWEEKQKDTKELQQQVELQTPMPRVGFLVRGRWLGPSFRAVNERTKVDPRRLKAVAQRVEDDDVMVELQEIPCLGIIKSSSIIACKEMDPAKLEGHVTTFPTTNILGIGLSAFVELRMPTIALERLQTGDMLEGMLDRLLSDKRQANLGDEWIIHLNCEHRRQSVEGRWRLETPADLRLNRVLRKGSRICNLKVLSIDPTQKRVQLSPTEGEVVQLQNNQVLQGIVGKIFEYGIFFEVGCRKRVLCRSCHLLRPVDEYSEGQVVRRLFVFQTSAMSLPQLCEGGAPARLQPLGGAMEAFGVEEQVSLLGWVVCLLPYGLVIELQDVERDAFCKETNLLKALQAYSVGDELNFKVLTASFVGDIEVQEVTAANTSISDCGENGLGQPAAGAGREDRELLADSVLKAAWVNCRAPLLARYDMVDSTPPEWIQAYEESQRKLPVSAVDAAEARLIQFGYQPDA
ncbi:unnamed protein product [Cladocopium goreaui]|uniref:S1 motif domain-containing protein n=1 Tax=Cladocopium goreaui TaxID=2562237 RepID=A0A9P1CRH8_9DINO|nr:unnamed protein product [Cladocopium goreaui]